MSHLQETFLLSLLPLVFPSSSCQQSPKFSVKASEIAIPRIWIFFLLTLLKISFGMFVFVLSFCSVVQYSGPTCAWKEQTNKTTTTTQTKTCFVLFCFNQNEADEDTEYGAAAEEEYFQTKALVKPDDQLQLTDAVSVTFKYVHWMHGTWVCRVKPKILYLHAVKPKHEFVLECRNWKKNSPAYWRQTILTHHRTSCVTASRSVGNFVRVGEGKKPSVPLVVKKKWKGSEWMRLSFVQHSPNWLFCLYMVLGQAVQANSQCGPAGHPLLSGWKHASQRLGRSSTTNGRKQLRRR